MKTYSPALRAAYWLGLFSFGGLCAVTMWEVVVGSGPLLTAMERYLSPDGNIDIPHKRYAQILLISGWLSLVLVYCLRRYPTFSSLPALRPVWMYVLIIVMCLTFMVDRHGLGAFPPLIYEEDGIFETLTALGYLIAAALIFLAAKKERAGCGEPGFVLGGMLLVAGLFLMAMEEISWGQRIIGWESPEYFQQNNDQSETNLHNFFNDAIWIAYQVVAMGLASLTIAGDSARFRNLLDRFVPGTARLLPAREFIWVAVLFVLIAHYNELFEEVFAVFAVVYALRLLNSGGD